MIAKTYFAKCVDLPLCNYAGLNIPLEIASGLFNAPRNRADA